MQSRDCILHIPPPPSPLVSKRPQEDVCSRIPQGYEEALDEIGYLEDSDAMKGARSEWKVGDKYLRKYFQLIDRAVAGHLKGQDFPLILASVEEYGPIYREVNSSPHLSNQIVSGNPEHCDLRELSDKARKLLHGELTESRHRALGRYKNACANQLSVEGLQDILTEAENGNLAAAFFPSDLQSWGTYSDQEVSAGEASAPETPDLYELAAFAALDAGSEIYFLEGSRLPTDVRVIGIKRWVTEAPTSAHAAAEVL